MFSSQESIPVLGTLTSWYRIASPASPSNPLKARDPPSVGAAAGKKPAPVVELAPTVQCLTGNYKVVNKPPFLDYVLSASGDRIIHDTFQSEEG